MKWSSLARWALWAITVLALGGPCSCEWLIQQPMCCWLFFSPPSFLPGPTSQYDSDYSLLPLLLPYSLLACPLPLRSLPVSNPFWLHCFIFRVLQSHCFDSPAISPSVGIALKTHSQVSWPFTFSTSGCWVPHSTSTVRLSLVLHSTHVLWSLCENWISE